jgi:hypothetical protein
MSSFPYFAEAGVLVYRIALLSLLGSAVGKWMSMLCEQQVLALVSVSLSFSSAAYSKTLFSLCSRCVNGSSLGLGCSVGMMDQCVCRLVDRFLFVFLSRIFQGVIAIGRSYFDDLFSSLVKKFAFSK